MADALAKLEPNLSLGQVNTEFMPGTYAVKTEDGKVIVCAKTEFNFCTNTKIMWGEYSQRKFLELLRLNRERCRMTVRLYRLTCFQIRTYSTEAL